MGVIGIVTSVNMADYLRATLPVACETLDRVYVVTSPDDAETHAVVAAHDDATLVPYADFYTRGAVFNKAGALRHAQGVVHAAHPDAWILVFDCDCLLPPRVDTAGLDPTAMYGCKRVDTVGRARPAVDAVNRRREIATTRRLPYSGILGAEAPYHGTPGDGYFQLYHDKTKMYDAHSTDASWSDVRFRESFPRAGRVVPGTVVHLNAAGMHWSGRTGAALSPESIAFGTHLKSRLNA